MGEQITNDDTDRAEDNKALATSEIVQRNACDFVSKEQTIDIDTQKSENHDSNIPSLAMNDKGINDWRVSAQVLDTILSSSSCETQRESKDSVKNAECKVEATDESNRTSESNAAITDEQVRTLLNLRTSASKSLKRFAEGVADFMCSNQDLEDVEPISCCSECICLDTHTVNVIDGNGWDIEDTRKKLEREINILLSQTGEGNDIFWMDNVCVWFNETGGEFDRKLISPTKPEELKSMLFRNRSQIVNAQATKIKRLRNQMHFNNQDQEPSKTSHQSSPRHTLNYKHSRRASTSRKEVLAIFSNKNKHAEAKNQDNEDSLFYDSDPETYNETRHDTLSSHPSSLDLLNNRDGAAYSKESHLGDELSRTFSSSTGEKEINKLVDVYDNHQVSTFIEEFTNGRTVLIWHPSPHNEDSEVASLCVRTWFEMGSRLKDKVLQPKFMWRDAYEPDLNRKKISACTGPPPNEIELLDIVRVLKPEFIDRQKFPFAKKSNCFTIHTSTNEFFLFECTSQQERDRFAHGLKLIVARLASQIITGDEKVFDEFFTPYGQLSTQMLDEESGVNMVDSNLSFCSSDQCTQ